MSNGDDSLESQKPVTVALVEIAQDKLFIERPKQQKTLK
nr:DNA-directed RNA polymerase subunit omega [Syntrophaceticus schinkii]